MPFKDKEKARQYARQYMRERRAAVKPSKDVKPMELVQETHFLSRFAAITYKLPGDLGLARFKENRFTTSNPQIIAYLKGHQDFGVTLFLE